MTPSDLMTILFALAGAFGFGYGLGMKHEAKFSDATIKRLQDENAEKQRVILHFVDAVILGKKITVEHKPSEVIE